MDYVTALLGGIFEMGSEDPGWKEAESRLMNWPDQESPYSWARSGKLLYEAQIETCRQAIERCVRHLGKFRSKKN